MNNRQCQATRKDGNPCGGWTFCDRCNRCYVHCEHVEEERAEARRRGGQATAQKAAEDDPAVPLGDAPRPPEGMEDAASWASWAAHMVATGKLGNSRGRTVATLLDTFRKCAEKGEARERLEETIERLEEAVEEGRSTDLRAV